MTTTQTPETMKAVVNRGYSKGAVESFPYPSPGPGSVTIRVLHSLVHNNAIKLYRGSGPMLRKEPEWPCIPGGYGVGRIASIGPDTTAFKLGQLVMFEPFVHARDDPDVAILWGSNGGFDEKTNKFSKDNWHNGSWAEYTRSPLENTWAIDEDKIIKLGLKTRDLVHLGPLAVVYGGLRKINVQAGETVLIAPATGIFSGGAVHVARAMGANVIAASRNADGLKELERKYPGIKTVQIKGGEEDAAAIAAHGPIDAFVGVSPTEATGSSHLGVGMTAVKTGGRICLMGGRGDQSLPHPYLFMVVKDITIRGSWMYERRHVKSLIKMVEAGVLRLDKEAGMEVIGDFPLEKFEEAMEEATKSSSGKIMVLSS
ncbi:unnamed protein product [Clonostachys solani]|uniref:Alcohol dehydrogenase n=1 Tax=Clonostachys solani TaxID=160281 RepID=A0A9N9ZKM8_9HYPO|nr:unnamed protein product [Clonostachys solani]